MRLLKGKGRTLINAMLAVLMVGLYIATSTPMAQSAMSSLSNGPIYRGQKKGMVALECAVSWNASAMAEFLDTLKEKGVQITFFVSGEWALANKEFLVRMVQEGHEVGTMGNEPQKDGSIDALVSDIETSRDVINSACGVRPELYYSGIRSVGNSTRAARRLDMMHVLCTVDLLSGRGKAADILDRASDQLFDGSIVLMQPTLEAAKALPAFLESIRQQGFQIGTVSQTLGDT